MHLPTSRGGRNNSRRRITNHAGRPMRRFSGQRYHGDSLFIIPPYLSRLKQYGLWILFCIIFPNYIRAFFAATWAPKTCPPRFCPVYIKPKTASGTTIEAMSWLVARKKPAPNSLTPFAIFDIELWAKGFQPFRRFAHPNHTTITGHKAKGPVVTGRMNFRYVKQMFNLDIANARPAIFINGMNLLRGQAATVPLRYHAQAQLERVDGKDQRSLG